MPDDLTVLRDAKYADQINQMQELLSQSDRAFLLGAGASVCAGLPEMDKLTRDIEADSELDPATKEILLLVKKHFEGAGSANIEDYMSEIIDALAIADRRKERGSNATNVTLEGKAFEAGALRKALIDIKNGIEKVIVKGKKDIGVHQKFVNVVHNALRAGKTPRLRPVDYFLLNYDTLIEDALALEKLSYTDGFSGGATAWWDASNFERKDLKARVLKVHGSIDWCRIAGDITPRRLSNDAKLSCTLADDERILIWPAATKYVEMQRDPYSQMLALLRKVLRQSTDTVLTICGYSFRDTHINTEIGRAIRESRGHLTVIILSSLQKPDEQLSEWLDDQSIGNQVRIYAQGGFFHGKKVITANTDLPWWKFEVATRLLGGER